MATQQGPQLVDWDLAVTAGSRLVRPGPVVTPHEAREAVAHLREAAVEAQRHVRDVTALHSPETGGGPVAVIDRPGWIRANAAGFQSVVDPVVARLAEKRAAQGKPAPSAATLAVGSRVTALETGGLLAFLAGKVLGQYELFPPHGDTPPEGAGAGGRLLLVAPNIVAAEQEMGVDPGDFRLWVCVHEETHRVQFTAVPWLRDHLLGEVQGFLDDTDLDAAVVLSRLRGVVGAVSDALNPREDRPPLSLLEAVQTPQQRAVLARVTAVMSLLEGHADYVMDAVGPRVIPSVEQIRRRFQHRREGAGRLDVVLRRLLGIDAKMRQYRDGARFVGAVVDEVGMAGFNRVWESAETLPTPEEIAEPRRWVARVHGLAA